MFWTEKASEDADVSKLQTETKVDPDFTVIEVFGFPLCTSERKDAIEPVSRGSVII